MKWMEKVDPDLRRLYRYFLPHKWRLAVAVVFLMGSASMSSVTATLLGKMTDIGFYHQEGWNIYAAPLALIGVTLGFAICTVMSTVLMAKVSQAVLVKLRMQLFESILHWPDAEYQRNTTGRISSKFVNEATMALSGAAQSFIVLVRDSIQVVALLSVLFWHDWQLTLVTFVIIPGLALTLRTISRRIRKIVRESQETLGKMISRVQETYEAERLVKVSNTYDFEEKRFAEVNEHIFKLTLKNIKMTAVTTPVTQMLTMVAIACVVGMALYEAQKGLLTIGEFITFLSALLLMKAPIQHLSGLNGTFASISVAAKSIFDTIDAEREKDDGPDLLIQPGGGTVTFENVTVVYPGKDAPTLKSFSLEIKQGERVALVGQSGSGKTTLVNLIARFLEPSEGRILIDGQDISKVSHRSLRRQMAFVTQDVVLFDSTLKDNLTYGLGNVTECDIQKALEVASLTELVQALPEGLETRVGEGGNMLSGGQKQRVSIARAFLKNAPILIMDEATSALDSKTEQQVVKAMNRLREGRTCITVAHRLGSVMEANRVFVMSAGKVIEEGSPQKLIQMKGFFYRAAKDQLLAGRGKP
ncbi:MAG: ABC transporter ATP-binding protein [Sutterella wadsworthensis]|jgi:lipid A export ATP-binding/permease protein msbA